MKGSRVGVWALAVGLMAVSVEGQSSLQERRAGFKRVEARQVDGRLEGTGTVQYDPGTPGTFIDGGGVSYVGNMFDTRNGLPLSPGTVTAISWYQGAACTQQFCIPGEGTSTGFAFVGVFPNAGNYSGFAGYAAMVSAYGFNSISVSFQTSDTFFVGLGFGGKEEGPGSFGSIGAATGTYNGQGFHGHQRAWNGPSSTALSTLNAVLRVRGSIVIPVELLEFELE